VDITELSEVKDSEPLARVEGGVGETLVVMAATPRADADAMVAGTENSGLHMGGLGGRNDHNGPRGAWQRVTEVPDGGEKQRIVGVGCWGVDEARRDVRGEAAEECIDVAGS
jgi:hypothetical protein